MSVPLSLRPTHDCFTDALEYLEQTAQEDVDRAVRLVIVHALLVAPNGEPYAHAWVEEDGLCWEGKVCDGVRVFAGFVRDEFYAVHRPIRMTRYAADEAIRENHRAGHYGPWDRVYRAFVNHTLLPPAWELT